MVKQVKLYSFYLLIFFKLLAVFRKSNIPIVLRNILLGLKHLFERLGKVMDIDIDEILTTLLYKVLKEEVTQRTWMETKYCLGALIHHLSEDKITFGLGKFLTEYSKPSQIMAILCIEKIIKKAPVTFLYNKGAGTLLNYLLKEMSSKEYEVVIVARRTFFKFIECGFDRIKLERFLKETITGEDFYRINEFLRRTGNFIFC